MEEEKLRKTISNLYFEILGREPDSNGLQYFLQNALDGVMTVDDITKAIRSSPEVQKQSKFLKNTPIFKSKLPEDEIKQLVDSSSSWYHFFKFGDIVTSPNRTSLAYQMWVAQGIPLNLDGKSILDIGTFDGFFSFLCENRGATRVLAVDNEEHDDNINNIKFGSTNFQICKKILDSKIEYRKLNVYDIDSLDETFDIVIMFGIYYHLDNVVSALKNIYSKVNDALYLSGHILESDEPIMYYYDTSKYDPNGFSRVVASPQCLINMGKTIGFKTVELLDVSDLGPSKKFPHMKSEKPSLKVGTFKFSK